MKRFLKLCATAVVVLSSTNAAFAANQSTDLKVQGTLVMGSCTPTLSSGGIADYGKLSVSALNAKAVNQLGRKFVTLSVVCESPTKVGWTVSDDRSETVVDTGPDTSTGTKAQPANEFGLGTTAGGINLGSYAVLFSQNTSSLVDGKSGTIVTSSDNGSSWYKPSYGGASIVNNQGDIVTYGDSDNNYYPLAFTTASDDIEVDVAIQDTDTLAITDDTPLDGQATISMVYL